MRILAVLIAMAAVSAMAAEQAETASQPAAVANNESAAAPAPSAASATRTTAEDETAGAEEEFRPPSGFKKKTRKGTTVYCRSETPVGTRFATEYCYTRADLKRLDQNQKSIQQDVQMRTKMCTTGSACSGGG